MSFETLDSVYKSASLEISHETKLAWLNSSSQSSLHNITTETTNKCLFFSDLINVSTQWFEKKYEEIGIAGKYFFLG